MIPFTHPANDIDQVDSEIKDMGVVLHDQGEDYQKTIFYHFWIILEVLILFRCWPNTIFWN